MKSINQIMTALFVALAVSCSKDDDESVLPVQPVVMEFPDDYMIPELSERQEININFSRQTEVAGIIKIEMNPPNAEGFTTFPAVENGVLEISVPKGATGASFGFLPQDNYELHGNKIVNFELQEEDDDFLVGDNNTLEVTVLDDEVASVSDFSWHYTELLENHEEEFEVDIVFSKAIPGEGELKIKVEGEGMEELFSTVPAMDANGIIQLTAAPEAVKTSFRIKAKNNNRLEKHNSIRFSIIEASGSVIKGNKLELELLLRDDELAGRLRSVEIINSSTTLKNFSYDGQGRIEKVETEIYGSGYHLLEKFEYNENNELISISSVVGNGEYFFWENGKLIRSEKVAGFMGTNQSIYEYTNGKLSQRRDYSFDGNRNATETDRFSYTYHSSGNLRTVVHSSFINGSWQEVSSTTYDSYSENVNPYPFLAAPGLALQQHLHGSFLLTQNNITKFLYYTQKFDAEGKITERFDGFETIKYVYY